MTAPLTDPDIETMEALLVLLRKHGVARIRMGDIEVAMGLESAPVVPEAKPAETEATRDSDGLTKDEQELFYSAARR